MNLVRLIILLLPIMVYAQTITIAVDAIHGKKEAIKQWTPTVKYLNKKIPKYSFKLYPFLPNEFSNVKEMIQDGNIDFIISPPAMYVDMEVTLGASKILTLVKQKNNTEFGSVIISNKLSNITKLSQIDENTRIAAVASLGFGGWLIGYDTLKSNNVKVKEEDVIFVGTQEKVVKTVLENKADIGIIRTGILEDLQEKKRLNLQDINILNQQHHKGFPFICSTKLYPEWAFARTKNVNVDTSRAIAIALLTLPKDSNVTKSTGYYYHWTVPYDYKSVRELMQRLQVGPYVNEDSKFIKRWINNHKELFYSIIFILFLVVLFLIYAKYINTELIKKDREKELLLEEIKNLAYNDALTNIPNRLSVMQSFNQALATAQRNNLKISVMFIDLDGFKMVNDTLGHDVGDRILKDVASILQSTLRKSDLCGRLGGDEFIVITSENKQTHNIESLARKLLEKINEVELPHNTKENFGASIGIVSIVPCQDTTVESLLSEADELMYSVKRQGKNNYILKNLEC